MTNISPITDQAPPRGQLVVIVPWHDPLPTPHEFEAAACHEEEGGFSIFALHYPEVISQGDDLDEAAANIKEAFLAVLEAKQQHGEKLSFSHNPVDVPANCMRLRIRVDG